MKKSNFSEAQIAFILRQAEEGTTVDEVCRKAGSSIQTYYRWRKKYGGLMPSEMKRLRQIEEENRDLVPLTDHASGLGENHPEHFHRHRGRVGRYGDAVAGGLVDVGQQALLGDLAPDDVPSLRDEGFLTQGGDRAGGRKLLKEGEEPIAAAVSPEALRLREVERQVVGQHSVPDLGAPWRRCAACAG